MRRKTSASQACGPMPLSLAVAMRVYIAAARSPPRSEPANSHDRRPSAMPRNGRPAARLVPGVVGYVRRVLRDSELPSLSIVVQKQTAQRPLGSSLILSVNLVPRRAQARDAVALEIAFPGEEFVHRKLVHPAGFIDWNSAAAHGEDESRLAAHRPSLAQSRELWNCQCLRGLREIEIVAHARQ
jgi:hypothetical protein